MTNNPMTGEEIEEGLALDEAATAGPWEVRWPYTVHSSKPVNDRGGADYMPAVALPPNWHEEHRQELRSNMEFIAAAREGWPRALKEVQRLREGLHEIIRLDHHNHGPESRATTIARNILNGLEPTNDA